MNDRILELAAAADDYADQKLQMRGEYHPDWHDVRDLKFAELIVRECMWKIMQRKEEAIDNNWHVDEAMSAAVSDIADHFGVLE